MIIKAASLTILAWLLIVYLSLSVYCQTIIYYAWAENLKKFYLALFITCTGTLLLVYLVSKLTDWIFGEKD